MSFSCACWTNKQKLTQGFGFIAQPSFGAKQDVHNFLNSFVLTEDVLAQLISEQAAMEGLPAANIRHFASVTDLLAAELDF